MKVVFLDRDGVVNKYPGDTKYVTSWREFHFLPGAKKALERLTKSGYKIFVISNQAGVAKGIYSRETLEGITANMLQELSEAEVKVSGVYYCTHRDEDDCPCRKPKAGLLEKVIKEHNIPNGILRNSFFVGDTYRDIQAGRSAGCKAILVFSGKEKPGNQTGWLFQPDFTAADLLQAVNLILSRMPLNEDNY
ncbi:MAG: HAD family hydrolase [Candidatus Omnitrophota bacterium]